MSATKRVGALLACVGSLAGCGGASGAAKDASGPTQETLHEASIGEAAVQEGGLSSLGEAATGGAPALASSLSAILVDKKKPKIDGALGEWPARVAGTTVLAGSAGELGFAGAIQYDDQNLYVACETNDPHQDDADHCALTIAFPGPGGALKAYAIALYPGKPGISEGRVVHAAGSKKGQAVSGAKIVEAPRSPGLTLEAVLPWSTFPEGRSSRLGLRGAMSYHDAASKPPTVLATGAGSVDRAAELPALPTEPEQALIEGLLQPRGLASRAPKVDLYADVSGDAMKERVAVFDNFFTILGHGYRNGREFFFRDLGSAELVRLEARDVTGDGKDDLLIRRRFNAGGTSREWLEVWQIGANDEPVTVFAHEIAIARGSNRASNTVHIRGKEIEIAVEPAVGWTVDTFHEGTNGEVDPLLLPWGAVRSTSYRFEGGHFVKANEVAQAPTPPAGQTAAQGSVASIRAADPPTPAQGKGGDLSKQLFEQFKRDRKLAASTAPTTDIQVNVADDERPERVVLLGNDIVVFGPGFKGGAEYAFISLSQFASPGSVKELVARDLDGDGAADLVVRGTRVVQPGQGNAPDVVSEATFVYALRNGAIQRIFAVETAREQGKDRVQGLVQFVPSKGGKGFDIDVRPGRASGFTAKSYPWHQEQPGSGLVEPLLLPWGGISNVRYAWNGSQFAPSK